MAYDLIRSDRADLVLAGGASSILNPEHIRGFNELRALSTANEQPERASRPFSQNRDGFVIGEGAAVLVLESETSAQSRQAPVFAEFLGYSMTNEAYNLMSPRAEGAGMATAMQQALDHAGVSATEIDYINAHGTSTVQNDKFETRAIQTVFGERSSALPVSSSKSMLGHTAGACGAVEAVITVLSLREGVVTPTINFERDAELPLDFVPGGARREPLQTAMSNSFGFGGCNASLIFRRVADHAGPDTSFVG
jgi:3-oxoacyl-[acyl-carrier-protein] synthase II